MSDYAAFLAGKAAIDPPTGISEPDGLPAALSDFQAAIVPWALRRGRAALFAGTGLGKTVMELAWADAVARHTNRPVLILTPLAVAAQFVGEGDKFGIGVTRASQDSDVRGAGAYVTNYDKLARFDMDRLGGIVLDESSILKAFDGKTRHALIAGARRIAFRLAASATPAPNDFMELGNHAEYLGVMTHAEMLATFFIHDGGDTSKWRLKRHAEGEFWRWVASWAVMLTRPGDLGFADGAYQLPPLRMHEHLVEVDGPQAGMATLFAMEARTLSERLAARRDSIVPRVDTAAALLSAHDRPAVAWCNLNAESEALTRAIPGAVEVRGGDAEGRKEEVLGAFAAGQVRVLVTKPSICGFGMNWQHCHDTAFTGLNDSFEQLYQAVRRFWRFGQQHAVDAHLIAARTEGAVLANLKRKEADAARMQEAMVAAMAGFSTIGVSAAAREKAGYARRALALPSFLEAA
ncbi:helicase [Sphingomonas sp. CCH9-F2]|uniref:helicase n=1 Tax=Sphingomonas sp. CCH9-F2 TaxID=1768778 RepID=UPI00082D4FEE|nr:helicase [Sphingomonas sp. CCH9-F2]